MPDPYQFRQWPRIAMTLDDTADFEKELLAKIPNLRFAREPVEAKWLEAWKWGVIEATHLEFNRHAYKRWFPPVVMRHPGDEPLIYRKSITYPWDSSFLMWIEPEGWKPEWEISYIFHNGLCTYRLANRPRFWCEFKRSYFNIWSIYPESYKAHDPDWFNRREKWRPPSLPDDDHPVHLTEGSLWSSWRRGDKECQSFARKIFRIAGKYVTCDFREVDRQTLLPLYKGSVHATIYRAGHHAMKWAAARRHNYIFGYLKPPDYDFGSDEPAA